MPSEHTLHPVRARCPVCRLQRTLTTYAPADKVEMDRLCDGCNKVNVVEERPIPKPIAKVVELPTLVIPRRPRFGGGDE